ncbi:porin family protein [Fulvivirga sediminis]|uniref:PorT family protein n=1 Tax=Fulvivirga sediminis TaxID=2803949 RepID=A0A937FC06_9BACT|nr:porin family protein [Fulvivirga sediminis]MBL3658897.1 PorT family protein [Fulvivirga sediminis]
MKKISLYFLTALISVSTYATGTEPSKKNKETPSERLQPMKIRNRAARPDIPGSLILNIGWNILQDNSEELEISTLGSRTFEMYYLYDMPLGNSGFEIRPGIGIGVDKFKFDKKVTIDQSVNANGDTEVSTVPLSDDWDVAKSQLASSYVDIPLEIRFFANPDDKRRSFNVSVGGKIGVRFSSHTKVKYSHEDENAKLKIKKDFGLNRFRYGLTGRLGIGGFNLFYYQSLSPLFDDGPAGTDDATKITVGLTFTAF